MELYHVSCKEYKVGTVLSTADFEQTEYYQNAKNLNKNRIDETLDKHRPNDCIERKRALFAFDNLGNCFAFKKGKCPDGLNFFRVCMKAPKAYPMCLTDAINNYDEDLNIKISNEYWKPKETWKFLEYLSSEMTIIEKVSEPDKMTKVAGQINYQCDFELRNKLFFALPG